MTRNRTSRSTSPSMKRRAREQLLNDWLPAIMLASIALGVGAGWLLTYTGVIL